MLGECGRLPFPIYYIFRCVKYWIRLVTGDNVYTRSCYNLLKSLSDAERVTWASDVEDTFNYGFGHVWIKQTVGDLKLFLESYRYGYETAPRKISLLKLAQCQNYRNIANSNFRWNYSLIKRYICKESKIALTKFRCQNHKLSIERFRGTLGRSERICMFCVNNGIRVIEDEYHLIFICPLYKHLRSIFLQGILPGNSFNAFCYVMSCNNEYVNINLSKYVYHGLDVDNMFNKL